VFDLPQAPGKMILSATGNCYAYRDDLYLLLITYFWISPKMEYNSVTFVAYFSAAVVAALLAGTYLFQLLRGQKTWIFLWAAALHTIHLGVIALSFSGHEIPLHLLIIFEYLH